MKQENSASSKQVKWLLIFGGWTFAALVFASFMQFQYWVLERYVPFWQILLWQLVSSYAWLGLTPLILWLAKRFPLENPDFWRQLMVHVASCLALVLFHLSINALLLPRLGFPPTRQFATFFEAYKFMFTTNFLWSALVYCAVLGMVFGVSYYHKFRERELRASQLEATLAQTRLQVLKMQLHPHFLFNTHNAISELIHKDPRAAEQMLTNLSDLLRIALEKLDVEEVTLQQELDFLKKYLEIEQTRFHDRLQVKMQIDAETLDAAVPNMILQPLIENAIKHGIAPLLRGGTIEIRAARENGKLHLQISDDGIGIGVKNIANLQRGIGLSNTRARLLQLYKEFNFDVQPQTGSGCIVSLKIPFKQAAQPDFTLDILTDLNNENPGFNRR